MTDQAASPPKQASPRGPMDPPAAPGLGRGARDSTSTTPAPAPAPSTPGRRQRTLLPGTPRSSSSPFPTRAPRTPGASSLKPCTVDETQYSRVTVHTAKCTECDQRNMDTMRRCPGCTFQVCQPCYEKRLRDSKGLLHGNMATPGAAGSGLGASSAGRAVRRKPVSSTPEDRSTEKKMDKIKEEKEVGSVTNDAAPPTQKSSGKKRAIKKKALVIDSEMDESSDDEFEPDDTSPTPSKRPRNELTFAESALATATRTPPATRATRRSLPTPTYQPLSSPRSDPANEDSSSEVRLGGFEGGDFMGDKGLYDVGIKPYKDQPLLARREPVMSNPVSRIPEIIKRNGKPRPEGQLYENVQKLLRAKMQPNQATETVQEDTLAHTAEQSKKAGQDGYPQTVGAFVEQEAAKYQNDETMDEDENKAIFNAMESAALVWGKHTYKKLDPETQGLVQPGLKLRLDRIDDAFRDELVKLMDEHAGRILSGLGLRDEKPATVPPGLLFKPA